MKYKVIKVASELVIQLDRRWNYRNLTGSHIKIKGLLPATTLERKGEIKKLKDLVLNKEIEIVQPLFVSDGTLSALIKFEDKFIQDYFEYRRIPVPASRLMRPEETRNIGKILGGIPTPQWKNPIAQLPIAKSPFLGNITYPVRPWDKDFHELKTIADYLYTDSHYNKPDIDRWFNKFLSDRRREAPVLVVGEVGIGKSWMLAHKLMNLPQEKYHVIVFDLRNMYRGERLEKSLEYELNEYLNYYINDINWIYPDFMSLYGKNFNPEDPEILKAMQARAASLDVWELNRRRLRYYGFPGSPDLIIAFDNIDHYTPNEQEKVVQVCRQLYGCKCGVRALFAIRPTTMTLKNRMEVFFGDSLPKSLHLRSPNVFSVLEKRFSINNKGEKLNLSDPIKDTDISWGKFLEMYRNSDCRWGLASFLMGLCSTMPMAHSQTNEDGSPICEENDPEIHTKYDLRHYLRVFRRISRSSWLQDLKNIKITYYGIQALMLRTDEPMTESESYLFNLFDNEEPLHAGNAMIRYRVLEYADIMKDMDEDIFNTYFLCMGYSPDVALEIMKMFESAGLIEITYFDEEKTKAKKIILTIPGRRQLEVVTNLWYIICAKTGMNIYMDYVQYGEQAKKSAGEFVRSPRILEYYGTHGWVPEEKFMEYLAHEESLEEHRIGEYQEFHPEQAQLVSNWMKNRSKPFLNIYFSYQVQLNNWQKSRHRR